MFGHYTFSEPTFAQLEITGSITPSSIIGGGGRGAKKKYKQYEIYDRIYWLTDSEYSEWHKQHLLLKKQLKNKTSEELFDIIKEQKPKYKNIAELIIRPVYEIRRLEIPLIPKTFTSEFDKIAFNRLTELNQKAIDYSNELKFAEKVRISELKKLKKREEELILTLLLL